MLRAAGYIEMAEGEGFEPPVPLNGTTVFKTVAFGHSATPPALCGRCRLAAGLGGSARV